MNKFRILLTVVLFGVTGHLQASMEDIIASCNDCHGPDGVSQHSDVPTIAGYSEATIYDMMFAFVDQTRKEISSKYRHGDTSRPEKSMVAIAKELTEEQIEALAVHYSQLEFVPAKQEFDAALVSAGEKLHEKQCQKCHEDGGSSPDDDAGILAGQWSDYLRQVFTHYRNDERASEEEMIKKVKELSDQQIDSLIAYYASMQ
ncbi:c-type cytochrome [Thalassotalea aquiviva]|uniref:c-type cytochrome n=1 Tax=Thalassotalea aquiviva TaxID=3242415 RepID=UPI00352B22F4